MKIFLTIIFLIFCLETGFATDSNQTESDEKSLKDVKTFDFERVFREADEYYEAAEKWEKLKCTPKSGFVCSKHLCQKLKLIPDANMILDKKSKTIALCKKQTCKYFSGIFEQTGIFINAFVKDASGIYVRVLGDGRYKEVSMVGLDAYLTNGECVKMEKKDDEKK